MSATIESHQVLQSAARQGILAAVSECPGLTLTDLSNRLGFQRSTIIWHTDKLRKAGLLRTDRVGGHRLFYASQGGVQSRQTAIVSIPLRQPCTQRLYEILVRNPGVSLTRLAALASMNMGRAHWHAKRLIEAKLAIRLPAERGLAFHPLPAGPFPAARGRCDASRAVPVA